MKAVLFLLALLGTSCVMEEEYDYQMNIKKKKNEISALKISVNPFFMLPYFEEWNNYDLKNEKVQSIFRTYFSGTNYRIIWNWDTDGDGNKEFLAVEEYPGIYKGIKRGILVREDANIIMYIDRENGFYTPDYKIYDFKAAGIMFNELECIRLLYNMNDVRYSKRQLKDLIATAGSKNILTEIGIIRFQVLDNTFKVMTSFTNESTPYMLEMIDKLIVGGTWDAKYEIYTTESFNDEYKWQKAKFAKYRENKSKGLVYAPPNFNPQELLSNLAMNVGISSNH